ncbi:MAG: ABC transporter ATP-binding protein [Hyphomicrobiales bacterium]
MTDDVLIEIEGLTKIFPVRLGAFGNRRAEVRAVDGLNFDILRGETLSLVGESGCGKSTAGSVILNLETATSGAVRYNGRDIAGLTEAEMRPLRRKLQVVFQDPYSTLNPRMTVGECVAEVLRFHKLRPAKDRAARVTEILGDVGLPPRFAHRYPHELSGGQRQRIAIARALACEPEFIVCDEAISALDVSIQAQILNLLVALQKKYGLTYLFIAHDLAVVRHISQRVAVMYLGHLCELTASETLFSQPLHPYTRALMASVPIADPVRERARKRAPLQGEVPSPISPPSGCVFHTRCPIARAECEALSPDWREARPGHWVACHFADDETT